MHAQNRVGLSLIMKNEGSHKLCMFPGFSHIHSVEQCVSSSSRYPPDVRNVRIIFVRIVFARKRLVFNVHIQFTDRAMFVSKCQTKLFISSF